MNSIRLSLGKNAALLQFGKSNEDGKTYASLASEGTCCKLVLGDLGGKQKEARCDAAEPLLAAISTKGFTAYWVAENHDSMEIIRIVVDLKAHTLEMALCAPEEWVTVSTIKLDVFSNPEFKFYNYRSALAAKPLNAPKRPRGRPRKPTTVAAE
jgi:hypothetical protein